MFIEREPLSYFCVELWNGGLQTSQTSLSLASREMNFWVLSLDQVIVILLSIVNVCKWISWGQGMVQVWGCDDMLSLRIFQDLFWHFTRVLRQYEVTKGVKSRNSGRAKNRRSWRDFVTRMKV